MRPKASLSAIREHSRSLAKNDDFAGSPLNRLGERCTSHCVIPHQRDQFLDVCVVVIPHLKSKVPLLCLIGHLAMLEQIVNLVEGKAAMRGSKKKQITDNTEKKLTLKS